MIVLVQEFFIMILLILSISLLAIRVQQVFEVAMAFIHSFLEC